MQEQILFELKGVKLTGLPSNRGVEITLAGKVSEDEYQRLTRHAYNGLQGELLLVQADLPLKDPAKNPTLDDALTGLPESVDGHADPTPIRPPLFAGFISPKGTKAHWIDGAVAVCGKDAIEGRRLEEGEEARYCTDCKRAIRRPEYEGRFV